MKATRQRVYLSTKCPRERSPKLNPLKERPQKLNKILLVAISVISSNRFLEAKVVVQ